MTSSNSNNPSSFPPIVMTQDKLNSIEESIQLEIEDRVNKLRHKLKMIKASMSLRFDLDLSRYPKEIRAMNWLEFCRRYDGNIAQYENQRIQNSSPAASRLAERLRQTPSKKQNDQIHRIASTSKTIQKSTLHQQATLASAFKRSGLETPRLNPLLPNTPSAAAASQAMRLPTCAESIMSVNGSPLVNLMDTNTSRRSTRIVAARESSIISVPLLDTSDQGVFELQLDAGAPVNTTATQLRELDSPARRQVVDHLQKLQRQLASFVDQIQ